MFLFRTLKNNLIFYLLRENNLIDTTHISQCGHYFVWYVQSGKLTLSIPLFALDSCRLSLY